MRWLLSFQKYKEKHRWVAPAVLCVIAFLVFWYIQLTPTLPDPDSFYHIQAARELLASGMQQQFPWLSATTLAFSFADHHLLYHIILLPFVTLLPPFAGAKFATALFATFAILGFYQLLKSLQVRGAWGYALFLTTIGPFIFRLNLVKAQALVLAWLFVCLYLLFHRKPLPLLVASFVYSWLYGGWPILVGLTLLYATVSVFQRKRFLGLVSLPGAQKKNIKQNIQLVVAVILGVGAGVLFSPYFPANISFLWQQVVDIGLINYKDVVRVGGEWYGYGFVQLLQDAILFFVVIAAALVAYIRSWRKQATHTHVFALYALAFFLLTLKSKRNVEYFIPFGLLFSATALSGYFETRNWLARRRLSLEIGLAIGLGIVIGLVPFFAGTIEHTREQYQYGRDYGQYAKAALWLQDNTPADSIVFHSDWDEFPSLWYYNQHNRYIVGLDPTFMYEYNPELYRTYAAITLGDPTVNMHQEIAEVFNAKYVLVDYHQNAAFDEQLASNIYFTRIYQDDDARIYQVTP